MNFGPHRSGGYVRTLIHYNKDCPHGERPLPTVRLAWLQGRVTGDFTQALIEIGFVGAEALSDLEAALLEHYRLLILWEQGEVSVTDVINHSNTVIELAEGTPYELYKGNVAAEMRAMQVLVYTQAGNYASAQKTLDHFFSDLPDGHVVWGLYYLADANLQFAQHGPATALRSLEKARTHAAQTDDPCFREVCAVNVALMQASAGEYDAAQQTLSAAGLSLADMEPIWDPEQPVALQAELATHCYVVVAE